MQSSLPKSFIYSLTLGIVLILFLLLLPSLAALDGEHGNDWAIFFGRFHIVVLHLPIGWLMIIPILEYIAHKTKSAELKHAVRIILYVAALSAVLAVVIGFTLASADGYSGNTVTTHMWLGITTAICTILACLLNESFHLFKQATYRAGYLASLITALIAVTWGGHLGGSLVQGEGYLTEKLPTELKVSLGLTKPETLLSYQTPIYQSFIEPILAAKCQSCHNEGKVKGQFQLDTLAGLLTGGKSKKPGVVPGNANKSEVFHRVTLPENDDSVMPPEGRTPLNADEITLLKWWINAGAPTNESIAQLSKNQLTPEANNIVDSLIVISQEKLFPTKAYTSIDAAVLTKQIDKLKTDFGIIISPLSQNPKDGLHISAFNFHTSLNADAWQALSPLKAFITSIDIGGMEITEQSLQGISEIPHLQALMLDNASLKTSDLTPLTTLQKLNVLNLFNTQLTDQQAQPLTKIASLKKLYLGQTKISAQGVKQLQEKLAHTEIFHSLVVSAAANLPTDTSDKKATDSKSPAYANDKPKT